MPIIDIELVVAPNGMPAPGLAQSLADAVGRALGSLAGQTWVRLHLLAREHYAENESTLASTELPVFVTVLKRTLPAQAELSAEVATLTNAIAVALGRAASRVHVEYAPAANERVSFGGNLVT